MPIRLATAALVAALLAAASPALAFTPVANPTQRQIQHAVRSAVRSPELWSTVNICDAAGYRNKLGIRGEMPALGFQSQLSMTIVVDYWAAAKQRFEPDTAVKKVAVALGTFVFDAHQAGTTLSFGPHAGLLRGAVTFEWKRAGTAIGSVTRTTTGSHTHVDGGHPPEHSAATCMIS